MMAEEKGSHFGGFCELKQNVEDSCGNDNDK
jgi:hypothetical protein